MIMAYCITADRLRIARIQLIRCIRNNSKVAIPGGAAKTEKMTIKSIIVQDIIKFIT